MPPIFCGVCDWQEQSLIGLEVHLLKKHRDFLKKRMRAIQKRQILAERMAAVAQKTLPAMVQNCETCSLVFHSSWSFRKHVRTVHPIKNSFRCLECVKSFLTQAGLNRHRSQSHKVAVVQDAQPSDGDDDVEVLEVSTEFASVDADVKGEEALAVHGRISKSSSKRPRGQKRVLSLSKLVGTKGLNSHGESQVRQTSFSTQSGPESKIPFPDVSKSTSHSTAPTKPKQSPKTSPPPEKRTKADARRDSVVIVNSVSKMDTINSNNTSPKTSPNANNSKKTFMINCTKCKSSFANATLLVTHIKAAHLM